MISKFYKTIYLNTNRNIQIILSNIGVSSVKFPSFQDKSCYKSLITFPLGKISLSPKSSLLRRNFQSEKKKMSEEPFFKDLKEIRVKDLKGSEFEIMDLWKNQLTVVRMFRRLG